MSTYRLLITVEAPEAENLEDVEGIVDSLNFSDYGCSLVRVEGLPESPLEVREPPHKKVLTTLDRNDHPIPPTCAVCGRPAEFCTGR